MGFAGSMQERIYIMGLPQGAEAEESALGAKWAIRIPMA